MKKCLGCGEINDNETMFCVNCGNSEFEEIASVTCPNCKAEVRAGAEFCTECGSRLPGVTVEEARRGQDAESETFDCPHCNNAIPVTSVYCPYCGQEVNNFTTNRKVKKYICPNCGQPNDVNARFCSYCFFDLDGAAVREMTIVVKPRENDNVKLLQCVLVSEEEDGEEYLASIDDDDEYERIGNIFLEKLMGYYDSDEEEEDEDEDDGE